MGFAGFMSDVEEERIREKEAADLIRIANPRRGMSAPFLVHPVKPKDDNARKAGCKCNHRSSHRGSQHHPDCMLYQS